MSLWIVEIFDSMSCGHEWVAVTGPLPERDALAEADRALDAGVWPGWVRVRRDPAAREA